MRKVHESIMPEKTIGIIGGIAPPSTIDYYQKIIKGYHEKNSTTSTRHCSLTVSI